MNANTTIIETANLTDEEWELGKDGIFLSKEGWLIRKDGVEMGPWPQREYAEEAAPEYFS